MQSRLPNETNLPALSFVAHRLRVVVRHRHSGCVILRIWNHCGMISEDLFLFGSLLLGGIMTLARQSLL